MEPNTLRAAVRVGDELVNPPTHVRISVSTGKPSVAETAAIAAQIGEFQPLRLYLVLRTVSAEAAQELAGYLTETTANILEGRETESALAELIPLIKPNPDAAFLGGATFTAANDSVVIRVGANDSVTSLVKCGIQVGIGPSIKLADEEMSLDFEFATAASALTLFNLANAPLEVLKNASLRLNYLLSPAFLTKLGQILVSQKKKMPEEAYNGLIFLKHLYSQDFELAVRSPADLPQALLDLFPSFPPFGKHFEFQGADQRVLSRVAELTTGDLEIYFNFKALVKVSLTTRGISDVLSLN
jgi:hypothetical protein